MSHQDLVRKSAEGTSARELYKAFQWLFPAGCFDGITFRADCAWTPRLLTFAALLWAWSDFSKLGRRFGHALQIIGVLFKKQYVPRVSYQAFIKMLRRWTGPLMDCIRPVYREKMRVSLGAAWRLGKWTVFAVDCSRVRTPRTRSNEERYSPKSNLSRKAQQRRRQKNRKRLRKRAREEQANVPQIWVTVLWHAASGLPWEWQTGPSDSSERDHLRNMLDSLPDRSMLAADAGFVGYDLWREILRREHRLLIRVGGNVRLLRQLGSVKRDGDHVYLWPDRAAKRNLPPLVLRLIVLNTGRRPVYLVTDLGRNKLSDAAAAEIYRSRWGIEVFYRHCKQTFDRAKLRSKNADNAEIEWQWSLMSMWTMGLYSHVHLAERDVPPRKISFVGVLDAFRDAMRGYGMKAKPGERLLERIALAVIDDYRRRNKTSRGYPRKKQEKPPGKPIIQKATALQKRKARQIQELQFKRLTA
jgi:hypothetical protein